MRCDEHPCAFVGGGTVLRVAIGQEWSVSAFVSRAVADSLASAEQWRQALDESLAATGGPMTDSERAWADELLRSDPSSKPS